MLPKLRTKPKRSRELKSKPKKPPPISPPNEPPAKPNEPPISLESPHDKQERTKRWPDELPQEDYDRPNRLE